MGNQMRRAGITGQGASSDRHAPVGGIAAQISE